MSWMQRPLGAINKVATVSAPIGGVNARDSLIAMPESDAVVLRNWWPQPYGLAVRNGFRTHASGLPAAVETLAAYPDISGVASLYAWSDEGMYDVTVAGPVGAAEVTGLSNARWQSTILSNDAGTHLLAVNGADNGILVNSGGISRIVPTGGTGTEWLGLDPKDAIQLTTHQGRLWAVEKDSLRGWYLPPGAIAGTFVSFDFGPQCKRGGYLMLLSTWTVDDGNGAEDHLVAVTSNGEAIVYGGTDPDSDTAWTLVGVYTVGGPLSRRAFSKVAGDLLLLTQRGVVSMADMLVSTKVNQSEQALKTSQIQFLVQELTSAFSGQFGWQLSYFPVINQLMINIPSSAAVSTSQLVSNQVVPMQPWAEFRNQYAACWGQFGLSPMFGDFQGTVYEAWYGNVDFAANDGTGGVPISAEVQQAYSFFGSPAVQKQIGMYRPNFITDTSLAVNSSITYDFQQSYSTVPSAATRGLFAGDPDGVWGATNWDRSLWPGASEIGFIPSGTQRKWIQAQGIGVAVSIALVISASVPVLWVSTDYSYKTGGVL